LILQAFLQRVFNSGGDVQREMATGKDRLDLCQIKFFGRNNTNIISLPK
jgi:hypothetical protein